MVNSLKVLHSQETCMVKWPYSWWNAKLTEYVYIGTSIKAVEDVVAQGKVCVLDIDMQGVKSVKKTSLNPKYIFIRPPSFDILEQRLRGRGTEKEEAIKARLNAAREELDYGATPGAYDHVIVNDDLDTAYDSLKKAIFVQ